LEARWSSTSPSFAALSMRRKVPPSTAILGFGVGVELGQLAFLALAPGAAALASRAARWPQAQAALVTTGGAASTYWLLEPGAALWSTAEKNDPQTPRLRSEVFVVTNGPARIAPPGPFRAAMPAN
jgi:hypothetical protein